MGLKGDNMRQIWSLDIDTYIEIVELAKARGKQVGESIEEELLEVMAKKGIKSSGCTELSNDELIKESASHGKNVLSIETKDGKTIYKTAKQKRKEEK
jgi:hypothetical protein